MSVTDLEGRYLNNGGHKADLLPVFPNTLWSFAFKYNQVTIYMIRLSNNQPRKMSQEYTMTA